MSSPKRQRVAPPQSVIILTGPTAVGKTELSLRLADAVGGEIISADSVQVYKGLDVGSAKITESERCGIKHHLLDIKEPGDDFSAGIFHDLAWEAVDQIVKDGKTPILVGGTGLYLDWFVRGKPGTPVSTRDTAAAAQRRLQEKLEGSFPDGSPPSPEAAWAAGCDLIAELGDPDSAARLRREPNNKYRMERVIEILLSEPGRTLADFNPDSKKEQHENVTFHAFFLYRPRLEMYRRIDARVEEMVEAGLLQEAALLLKAGVEPDSNCASKAIGYRQAMTFLQSFLDDPHASPDLEQLLKLVDEIQSATRKLCHRQMTWFRKKQEYTWLNAKSPPAHNVKTILSVLKKGGPASSPSGKGELTDAERYEMKRYQARRTVFQNPLSARVQAILAQVTALVDDLRSHTLSSQTEI